MSAVGSCLFRLSSVCCTTLFSPRSLRCPASQYLQKHFLSTEATRNRSVMGINNHGTEVLTDRVEKPLLDDRSYRVIRLQNQLEALLIHDPNTDKASAAMDVNAGSLSDEPQLPGMAHAVEHMLFMGNEKYPEENDYQQYLAENSGSHNAFTSQTSTNYFFEVGAGSEESTQGANGHMNGGVSHADPPLRGGLDRFSQFFVSPLFLEATLDRELRAVDSENKKNLQSDVWRLQQLRRSLSNPEHPNCKFSTGNLKTLRDDPVARGVKIRNEFMRFYDEQYSANRMKLAVLGQESLDQLQSWVEDLFGAVRNKNLPKQRWDIPIFTDGELLTEIFTNPVMDTRSLELSFQYPDEDELWASLPGRYIGHLIGHEGPGSILAYIKGKGWANSLSAGARSICRGTGLFEINIGLTPEGLKNYKDIVIAVFQYISILHETEPKEWIFEEQKRMSQVDFKFKQKSPASSTVSYLAGVMQSPMPKDLIVAGKSVIRDFNPNGIRNGISHLNPRNFRLMVVSKDTLQEAVQREKWYGTEYIVRKIPDDFLQSIQSAFSASSADRPDSLHLPSKNEFIPTRLDVEKKTVETPLKNPKLIRNDGNVRLWYKKDDQFWVPKANFYLRLRNPICGSTPRNNILGILFTHLVDDSLMEYAYDAELAGLDYSLNSSNHGLSIAITGYNDKMSVLLEKVLMSMSKIQIKDERFSIIKERLSRGLRNRAFTSPYLQIGDYAQWLASEKGWIDDQLLAELEHVTVDDVRAFQPLLLGQVHVEALAHGNLHREDALKLVDLAERIISPRTLPAAQWPITRSIRLPSGSNFVYPRDLADPANVNHAIEYVLQTGDAKDQKKRAALLLIDQMTKEPAFDRLRTKEQLGYVVFSGAIRQGTTLAYRFIIQSERTPEYLEERIDSFLLAFKAELLDMSLDKFESHRRSKINDRLEKEKNLAQESMRFWQHISNEGFHFDQMHDDAAHLRELTKDDVVTFFNHYIDPASSQRAKTSIYLRARTTPEEIANGMSPEEQKSGFLDMVQQYLTEKGAIVNVDQLNSRFAKLDFSEKDQKSTFSALSEYIRQDAGLSETQAAEVVEESTMIAKQVLSQMGIRSMENSAIDSNGDAGPDGVARVKKVVVIEDVHAYKASMPLTAGPTPVKPLSAFEDLEAKL